MDPAGISINRDSKTSLQAQLENAFRTAILDGTLAAGERVLSTRELQTHLGLSRNTVLNAFEQLHAEGYLTTERGVGTFVAPQILALPKETPQARERIVPSIAAEHYLDVAHFAQPLNANITSFRPGAPALDKFPYGILRRIFGRIELSGSALDYGDTFGDRGLRSAIARRLQQTRGVLTTPDHVMITSGAQAAFALIAGVLLGPRDRVIIEEPGYPNMRAILLSVRANIVPKPVDEQGLNVATFAALKAKLAYVTPSHQYPTGEVLSLDRRLQLLDWASRARAWIIEDDYDSEFNYTNRPIPALQGLAGSTRVIYVGTFSKVLAPSIRIGYVVLPNELLDVFRAAQVITGGTPDAFIQVALARFIDGGHLGRHISRMRKAYDEQRNIIGEALSNIGPGTLRVRDTRAGLHFIAHLPAAVRDIDFSQRAFANGVIVPPLSSYFIGRPRMNGIVAGYAATPKPQIAAAIKSLAAAL
ncbi:MAG: PLP-dependent aminotransferase family protein [Candidatus Baltobacteraceae bacterium]